MSAMATKLKVSAAAVAVGATAAIAPVAANAAPAVQIPAAPVHQVIGDLPEQGPLTNLWYFGQSVSIQAAGFVIRINSAINLNRMNFWQDLADDFPDTFLGDFAQAQADRHSQYLENLSMVSAEAGNGVICTTMGAYGAVTTGPCT